MKPLCFILMPFGKKKDEKGKIIDFDKIYNDFIKTSIEQSGLEPIRADEEQTGGMTFDHIVLLPFLKVIVDFLLM